ncbi:MAG: hypothetical protein WCI93_01860 [bacterium]
MPSETTINQGTDETPTPQDTPVKMGSSTPDTPLEAINAPVDNSTPEVVNNTTPKITENKAKMTENGQNMENTLENQASGIEPNTEPVSESIPEPVQTSETRTAQIPPNEPLSSEPEPIKSEPVPVIIPNKNKVMELLAKAKFAIQFRKRKKLDKIMTLFLKKSKITNDEVEKFLHVSDATAERYLNILEKENKIKQVGKTGKAVSYSKI